MWHADNSRAHPFGRLLSVDSAHGNLDKITAGPSISRLAEGGGGDANRQTGGPGGAGNAMYNQTNNMTARQMYELIRQLKGHVQNEDQAKALMTQNHLLCCEFLRMQERLGMLPGLNLPAPPARAAAPAPAPELPPADPTPYNPSGQAAGTGWNVPQVQQPHMAPPGGAGGVGAGSGGAPPQSWEPQSLAGQGPPGPPQALPPHYNASPAAPMDPRHMHMMRQGGGVHRASSGTMHRPPCADVGWRIV